jgi:uncharacterized protein YcaQ
VIPARAARRFLIARHLTPLPARPRSVLTLVRRLGALQFDPIEMAGARNHEITLFARVRGYEKGWCERWLYGAERLLFEAYNKALNILPIEELPYHHDAACASGHRKLLARNARDVERVLAMLRADGPLPSSAFSRAIDRRVTDGWGSATRAGRLIVEGLFITGRVAIARREGNTRWYDLVERLYPAELLARKVTGLERARHRLLTRVRGLGLLGAGGAAELHAGIGTAAERRALLAALTAEGILVQVDVAGVTGPRWVLAGEAPLLADPGQAPAGATLLAPLDPLLWDRRLVRELFGFDYTWEIYTPPARRKDGAYVLPVVYGDRLAGRIEPRFDRDTGTLRIEMWRPEPGFKRTAALDEALERYRRFVGAERLVF